MEAMYNKEEDDDLSPFLENGHDDDGEYNISTQVWLDGCATDQLTHLCLIEDSKITISNIVVIVTNA